MNFIDAVKRIIDAFKGGIEKFYNRINFYTGIKKCLWGIILMKFKTIKCGLAVDGILRPSEILAEFI